MPIIDTKYYMPYKAIGWSDTDNIYLASVKTRSEVFELY